MLRLFHVFSLLAVISAQACFDDYGSGFSNSVVTFLSNPLFPSDNQAKQRFGKALDIQDNRAVVCTYLTDSTLIDTGKCYVFVKYNTTWTQVQSFFGPNPGASDYFGYDVDMDDNWLIVGAPQDQIGSANYAGSATIYYWNGVAYVSPVTVTKSSPNSLDMCGTSVGIQSATYALMGCIGDDTIASDGGIVYIWRLVSPGVVIYNGTLSAPSGPNDNFGSDIAIEASRVVVGAAAYDGVGSNSGRAYIYDLTNNVLTLRYSITPSVIRSGDGFGSSVAIKHPYIFVGSPNYDDTFSNQGAAFLFYDNGTSAIQIAFIQSPVLVANNQYFAQSLALYQQSNSRIELIVGEYQGRATGASVAVGAAYIFVYDIPMGTVRYVTQLLSSTGSNNDYFGGAVAVDGREMLIGAERDNIDNSGSQGAGLAYTYTVAPCTNQTAACYSLSFDVDQLGIPLSAGVTLSTQYTSFLLTIDTSSTDHPAVIFNSVSPTCQSGTSIATPNIEFNGTGVGSGGTLTNSIALGNVVILQNTLNGCSPEVYTASASMIFNFSTAIDPSSIAIIDGRSSDASIISVSMYYDISRTQLIGTVNLPFIGTNGVQTLTLSPYTSTRAIVVTFGGPGAVAGLAYCVGNSTAAMPILTPIPAPLPAPAPIPSPLPLPAPAPIPSPLPAPAPSPLPLPSPDPTPSPLPLPSPAPAPSPSPSPIVLSEPNPSPSPTPTPFPPSPIPAPEPSPLPSPSPEPIPSPLPAPNPEPSPSPEFSSYLSPSSSYIPSPSPTPSVIPSPSPTPSIMPSPSPTVSPSPSDSSIIESSSFLPSSSQFSTSTLPVPSPSPTPSTPTTTLPTTTYQDCSIICGNYSGTDLLECDNIICNCGVGLVTCDVYSLDTDWGCVEPNECCSNPTACSSLNDCCGGFGCYNNQCLLSLPTTTPERPQPQHFVCNNTAYAGGEESVCMDLCVAYAGDTSFYPWTIGGSSLKTRCGYQNGWLPATSTCFFDLTGGMLEYGELTATIDSVVDQTYTIIFNYGSSSEASQIYNLYINVDGILAYTATAVPGIDNWNLVTHSFIATSTSHIVTLYSDQGFDDMGAYIDSPRIYTCESQPRPWCLKTYDDLSLCGLDSSVVDYQQKPCGCGIGVLNGDCLSMIWNFSLAEQCAADDDAGLFGSCETRPSTLVTRASIGECVETGTSNYAIVYQPTEAANARKRTISSTIGGYPVLEYLTIRCGECINLPNTTLYAKVACHTGTVSYYIDSSCMYAVSSEYVTNQYATVEYSTDYVFVLTATDNPDKCEMISLGQNCSAATRLNTSIEHSCWSEYTYLPAGTFAGSPYQSFRINCPSKQIQFFATNDCTGPVQYSDGSTTGCRIPHITVNISAQDDLLCGCGLSNGGSSSATTAQSSTIYSSSVQPVTSASESQTTGLDSASASDSIVSSSEPMVSDSLPAMSSSQLVSESSASDVISSSEVQPESSSAAEIVSSSAGQIDSRSDIISSSEVQSSSAPEVVSSSAGQLDSSNDIVSSSDLQPESSSASEIVSSSNTQIESSSAIASSEPVPSTESSSPFTSTPTETSQPWTPTTTTESNACFMEFFDENCANPVDYYGIQQNTCNALNGIASFGAFLNTTIVTTYVNQNCTVVTNAFAYGVCVQILLPTEHWGMFTLGPCFNITPSSSIITTAVTIPSSDFISSEIVQTSNIIYTTFGSSTIDVVSSTILTSTTTPSSLPASTGLFFYLPYTNTI